VWELEWRAWTGNATGGLDWVTWQIHLHLVTMQLSEYCLLYVVTIYLWPIIEEDTENCKVSHFEAP